jgi:hypothetical protein
MAELKLSDATKEIRTVLNKKGFRVSVKIEDAVGLVIGLPKRLMRDKAVHIIINDETAVEEIEKAISACETVSPEHDDCWTGLVVWVGPIKYQIVIN